MSLKVFLLVLLVASVAGNSFQGKYTLFANQHDFWLGYTRLFAFVEQALKYALELKKGFFF